MDNYSVHCVKLCALCGKNNKPQETQKFAQGTQRIKIT